MIATSSGICVISTLAAALAPIAPPTIKAATKIPKAVTEPLKVVAIMAMAMPNMP